MPLSGVTTNVQQGGLGRRAPSKDKISGIIWFNATYPTGLSAAVKAKKFYTLAEVEAAGITEVLPAFNVLWYHCREFFRMNPEGELWVGVWPVPGGAYTWAEVTEMLVNYANGEIRQLMIYANLLAYAGTTQVPAINAVLVALEPLGIRTSAIFCPNVLAATDINTLPDLRALGTNNSRVSVCLAQDSAGKGGALFDAKTFSITSGGAVLGAISKAKVQQSIGNPANFNFSDGTECEVWEFLNGALLSTLSAAQLGALKDKGYIVPRKYLPRLAGSFVDRAATATAATNDYAWLENQRTIDKAVRGIETSLTPNLQSGVYLKSDGTLNDDTVGFFSDLAKSPLTDMKAAGEISDFQVLIDPTQNVLSTSRVTLTAKILPVGVAEFITVNIGFTTKI